MNQLKMKIIVNQNSIIVNLFPFFLLAICVGGCNNGGTCVSPNTCECRAGWTGSRCGTGKQYIPFLGNENFPVNV